MMLKFFKKYLHINIICIIFAVANKANRLRSFNDTSRGRAVGSSSGS